MLLSLQIMAMLTWKEMPCVENLQIAYCVNCRNTNIPGYCRQRSVFCDCYRNTGHFLGSVERIKRFVFIQINKKQIDLSLLHYKGNAPSICIASSAMFPLSEQILRTTRTVAQWNLILAYLQHSQEMESRQTRSYLNEMLFCSYFDKIIYLLYNSQSL